jgi:hypothetical protein
MAEPMIPERLRRLHLLYLAAAQASLAQVGFDSPAVERLYERAAVRASDEYAAIMAAALALGIDDADRLLLRAAAGDRLREAAHRTVRLTLAVAAFKSAIDAPVDVPKSQFVERRTWLRQELGTAEAAAERAIADALGICGLEGGSP